jgi:hypothetical protein
MKSKMQKFTITILLSIFFCLLTSSKVFASELILRKELPLRTDMYFSNVAKIPDPSIDTKTIYGYLGTSYAADSYYFIPSHTTTVSIEVLVPVRKTNELFKPGWEIVGENITPQPMNIYFSVPPGSDYIGHDYYTDIGPRLITTDPVTLEKLYKGNQQSIKVIQGKLYYINIYDPFHYIGDYVLKIGNKPDTVPLTQKTFIADLYQIKTNQLGKTIDLRELIAVLFSIIGLILTGSSILCVNTKEKTIGNGNWTFIFGSILFLLSQTYLYGPNIFSGIAPIQLLTWQLILIFYVIYKKIPKTFLYVLLTLSLTLQTFLFVWYLFVIK